jgi:hypothetical protein
MSEPVPQRSSGLELLRRLRTLKRRRDRADEELEKAIIQAAAEGWPVMDIALAVGFSRQGVYNILRRRS